MPSSIKRRVGHALDTLISSLPVAGTPLGRQVLKRRAEALAEQLALWLEGPGPAFEHSMPAALTAMHKLKAGERHGHAARVDVAAPEARMLELIAKAERGEPLK